MIDIKVLFITSDYMKPENGSNIYTDLAEELKANGHDVKVVVTEEKKQAKETKLYHERGLEVLRVKIGNLYEVNLVEKAFTILSINKYLKKDIKKYFNNEQFDLILFESPPLTMASTVKWAMKKYHAPSYLMMKDIFPQNGVDIGLYSKNSPIYWYFRYREKKLYKISTKIGCMSQGNLEYLLKHNKFLNREKLELFPNTMKILKDKPLTLKEKEKIRKKYNLKNNDIVAIYGGNFGKPQGLDFLKDIFEEYKDKTNIKFVLVGKGTEKKKVSELTKGYSNILMFDYIPRIDYEKLLKACDIGLIFLDKRFTIPNFPSKTLSYLNCHLPIMASIDKNTDYGSFLINENCGLWVENGDIINFRKEFNTLIKNTELRQKMGDNGYNYLINNLDVKDSVKKLERFIGDENGK